MFVSLSFHVFLAHADPSFSSLPTSRVYSLSQDGSLDIVRPAHMLAKLQPLTEAC